MSALYKPFKSIEEIKQRGEFIKKGQVIPSRIFKANDRSMQVYVKAGSNHWAIPTPSGYIVFVENHDGEFDRVVNIKKYTDGNYDGSPHSGHTLWQGNLSIDYFESLFKFNKAFLSKCLINDGIKDITAQMQINCDYSLGN